MISFESYLLICRGIFIPGELSNIFPDKQAEVELQYSSDAGRG